MTLPQWQDAYTVSIDPVDRNHRALIDLIDRLHSDLDKAASQSAPSSIGALLESLSAHLEIEERMMEDDGYDDLASHKADHERLIDNLCDLIIMYAFQRPEKADCEALAQRLEAWLGNHFAAHDSAFLRAHSSVLPQG